MVIRPKKEVVLSLVEEMAPQYLEMFRDVQKPDGWRKLAGRFGDIRNHLSLDSYVTLYGNEAWIYNALWIARLGVDGFKRMVNELSAGGAEEQQRFVDEMTTVLLRDDSWLDEVFANSVEDQQGQSHAMGEGISETERTRNVERGQHLFAFIMAWFYNCISVMVHGEKLTSLVPKAIEGDRKAFLKAIHIDKSILHAHPDFKKQYEQALSNQHRKFLHDIGYRLEASPTRGKIQLPGVYMIFAMLESLLWLDELRHEEILDLCDDAGLDRWQNRIEDVNYLTKRLGEYRRMQKAGGLSMP